jgi:hypothetical protein
MDIDNPTSSPRPAGARELFVVQRCWHSGPHQYQPMDMMRLFTTQRDAEEAAYHSSHAWCRYHKPHSEPQVKTLLLPRHSARNGTGTSYGFVAFGGLFWVRSLLPTTNSLSPPCENQWEWNAEEAFCVVTEGVIGGTGNRMSRRGTEIAEERVFVSESDTRTMMNAPVNNYAGKEVMRRKALETCHFLMAQQGKSVSIGVATVPLGRPAEYTSGEFLKDWPPQVLQPTLAEDTTAFQKRPGFFGCAVEEDLGEEVACPFSQPPAAKRRRFCDDVSPFQTNMVEDKVMMSYAIAGERF